MEIKNEEQIKTILKGMLNKLGHEIDEVEISGYVSTDFLKKWAFHICKELGFKKIDISKSMYSAYYTRKNYYEYEVTETASFWISYKYFDECEYLRRESIEVRFQYKDGMLL